jgi:hypothetical protein
LGSFGGWEAFLEIGDGFFDYVESKKSKSYSIISLSACIHSYIFNLMVNFKNRSVHRSLYPLSTINKKIFIVKIEKIEIYND